MSSKSLILNTVLILLLFSKTVHTHIDDNQKQPEINIEFEMRLGQDKGQNFGTIFEVKSTQSGKTLFGAGFVPSYNTGSQNDRYQIEFYIRSQNKNIEPIERFVSPHHSIPSTYLYNHNNGIHIRYKNYPNIWFDVSQQKWVNDPSFMHKPSGTVYTVRGKSIYVNDNKLYYDQDMIANLATAFHFNSNSDIKLVYFGNEMLFFLLNTRNQSTLIAVPWSAYSAHNQPQFNQASMLKLHENENVVYAFGQFKSEILASTNRGLYAFKQGSWRILHQPSNTSFQIYSMINYKNELLMGHYPSGFIYAYDGHTLKEYRHWPPVHPKASSKARELQTMIIYRGELFVGLWPWGELWRLNPDNNAWHFIGRLFKYPEMTQLPIHPYEKQVAQTHYVYNYLGQRISSMALFEHGLMLGTSHKGGEIPIAFSFLTRAQREEYGAIHRFEDPANLVGTLKWEEDKPIRLSFKAKGEDMVIEQDGTEIARTKIDPTLLEGNFSDPVIRVGDGVFGRGHYQNLHLIKQVIH